MEWDNYEAAVAPLGNYYTVSLGDESTNVEWLLS